MMKQKYSEAMHYIGFVIFWFVFDIEYVYVGRAGYIGISEISILVKKLIKIMSHKFNFVAYRE